MGNMGSQQPGAMGGRMNQAMGGRPMGLRQPPMGSGTLPQLDTPFQPGPYAQQQPVMSSTMPPPSSSQGPASPAGLPQYWEGMTSQQVNNWAQQQPQMSSQLPAMPVTGGGSTVAPQMLGGPQGIATAPAPEVKGNSVSAPMGKAQPVQPAPQAGAMGGAIQPMGQAKPAQRFVGPQGIATPAPGAMGGAMVGPSKQNSGQRFNDFMGQPQKG